MLQEKLSGLELEGQQEIMNAIVQDICILGVSNQHDSDQDADDMEICTECGQTMRTDVMVIDENSADYYCEACYEEKFVACEVCGKVFHVDNTEEVAGYRYCEDCLDDETTVCDRCGDRVRYDDGYTVDEDTLCSDCADEHTSICCDCGERVYDFDTSCIDGETVCNSCVSESGCYFECCDCGIIHHEDNLTYNENADGHLCSSCADARGDDSILGYHKGPSLVFHGEGDYHIGIELEVDGGEKDIRFESAAKVQKTLDNHVYCCNDGSLDTGFEIISHPHTYDALMELPWEQAFSNLVTEGWRGHEVDTAGLHVHIGKNCFSDEDAIARFCLFFENNWDFVRKFSRRADAKLKQWASRYFGDDDSCKKITAKDMKDKTKYDRERYRAVNLCNRNTVEVRVFKSTLKAETFKASIELVKLVAERCNKITDEQAASMTIGEWLVGASDNLIEYTKKRNCVITFTVAQENNEGIEEVA